VDSSTVIGVRGGIANGDRGRERSRPFVYAIAPPMPAAPSKLEKSAIYMHLIHLSSTVHLRDDEG
jgi:hypothetical protein